MFRGHGTRRMDQYLLAAQSPSFGEHRVPRFLRFIDQFGMQRDRPLRVAGRIALYIPYPAWKSTRNVDYTKLCCRSTIETSRPTSRGRCNMRPVPRATTRNATRLRGAFTIASGLSITMTFCGNMRKYNTYSLHTFCCFTIS